jgi:hypothetical protein
MAHIQINQPHPDKGYSQIIINGNDFSNEIFRGVELVEVGEDAAFAQVGLRVTFAVSRLDLGDDINIQITDHLRSVAQRVRSTQGEDAGSVATANAPGGSVDLASVAKLVDAVALEIKGLRKDLEQQNSAAKNAGRLR